MAAPKPKKGVSFHFDSREELEEEIRELEKEAAVESPTAVQSPTVQSPTAVQSPTDRRPLHSVLKKPSSEAPSTTPSQDASPNTVESNGDTTPVSAKAPEPKPEEPAKETEVQKKPSHPPSIMKRNKVTNMREIALQEGSEEARKIATNQSKQGGAIRKSAIKVDQRAEAVTDMQAWIRAQNIQMVSPGEQLKIVNELLEKDTPSVSDEYFLVLGKWWRLWQRYVEDFKEQESGYTVYRPAEIDNSPLVKKIEGEEDEEDEVEEENEMAHASLKDNLCPHEYKLVPKSVWQKLFAWYGGKTGTTLSRQVVLRGFVTQTLHVELYPLHLRVMKVDHEEMRRFDFSPSATAKEVRRLVASQWGIPLIKCRLFLFNLEITSPANLTKTLEELGVMDYQILLMRGEKELSIVRGVRMGFSEFTQGNLLTDEEGEPPAKGAVGLHNANNSAFMTSVLQCLSHTSLLREYFLSQDYEKEINVGNHLGTKGEMAKKFESLLSLLWSNKYTTIAPFSFRASFCKVCPHFGGANQHLPEEFLEYFLNTLHEDLKKEMLHANVESSRIVDLFQGQTSTKWVCGKCAGSQTSVDPFLVLGTPIPAKKERVFTLVFVPREPEKSSYTQFGVKVGEDDTLQKVLDEFVKFNPTLPKDRLKLFMNFQGKEWLLPYSEPVGFIEKNEILWMFEVDAEDKRAVRSHSLKIVPHRSVEETQVSQDSPTTLEACLDLFSSRKVTQQWNCPTCKCAVEATRRTTFETVPEIFLVHLQRMKQQQVFQDLIRVPVEYPLALDMSSHKGSGYNLYAFTVYEGPVESGDYAAYCKNASNDKWYYYHGKEVKLVSEAEVLNQKDRTCLLAYRKAPEAPTSASTETKPRLKSMSRTTSAPNFNQYAPPKSNFSVPHQV